MQISFPFASQLMAQHGTKEETLLKPPREELAEGWLGEKGKRQLKSNGEDRRERFLAPRMWGCEAHKAFGKAQKLCLKSSPG